MCEILQIYLFGKLELVREKGFYFWDKPKAAKAFTHLVRDSGIL